MAKTYYLGDAASTHTVTPPGGRTSLGTTLLRQTTTTGASLSWTIPNSSTRSRMFEEGEDQDVTRSNTGTFNVEVNITTAFADMTTTVMYLHRVDSSGTVQASAGPSSSQSWATTGVKTYSLTDPALGTWSSTDRLVVEISVTNGNTHGGDDSATATVNTTDNEVSAPNFTGPPAISSASMSDSGRDWDTPYQDVSITFDQAVEKSGGTAYNVGDTIPGLTIGPSGSEGAVTYRSGDSTTTWVVRRAALAQQNSTWVIDYARSSGELVKDGGGSEVLDTTDAAITNNLTKRIRAILKRGDTGAVITTACDLAVLDAEPRDSDDAAWMAVLQRHPNITPTASGVIDVQASDASLAVGDPVYLAAFNPREDSSGSSTYARTTVGIVNVQ